MREMLLSEYTDELRSQDMYDPLLFSVVCPSCRRVQHRQDLIEAGAGRSLEEVTPHFGRRCVGSFPDAGWSCELTQLTDAQAGLEVLVSDGDGGREPRFLPATPEQAAEHASGREVEQPDMVHLEGIVSQVKPKSIRATVGGEEYLFFRGVVRMNPPGPLVGDRVRLSLSRETAERMGLADTAAGGEA